MSPAKAKTTKKKKDESKTKKKPAATAKKKATAKKTTRKKSASNPVKRKISAEERYNMVQTAAYFRAQRDSFRGDSMQYWIDAEKEIDSLLAKK